MIKIDKFGRLYETSSDREDGRGYKAHPTPVTQGDVTFGAAHTKAMTDHTNSIKRDMHNRMIEDRQNAFSARQQMGAAKAARNSAAREMSLRDNDAFQDALLRRAVMSGTNCRCENDTVNDQTQKAIKGALGMGANNAFPVDPIEAHQAQLNALNVSKLSQQARLNAAREKMGATGARVGVFAPKPVTPMAVHPLSIPPVLPFFRRK
jgi:hypothetical protein